MEVLTFRAKEPMYKAIRMPDVTELSDSEMEELRAFIFQDECQEYIECGFFGPNEGPYLDLMIYDGQGSEFARTGDYIVFDKLIKKTFVLDADTFHTYCEEVNV